MSVADLASLMPQGDGGETAGLLSKMVEMQGKLERIEGEGQRRRGGEWVGCESPWTHGICIYIYTQSIPPSGKLEV